MFEQTSATSDPALTDPTSICTANTSDSASKRKRWFELLLVLFMAFSSSLLYSIYLLTHGPGQSQNLPTLRMANGTVHEALCLALLLYVLSRRGRNLQDIGFRWSIRSSLIGLGLIIASYLVYALSAVLVADILHIFWASSLTRFTYQQLFGRPTWKTIPLMLINPFFEELIIRAYAMTEIAELTGSWTLATVVSALIQASYHLHYGWLPAGTLFFQFLLFSVYFARKRKAVPIIIAHAFFDWYPMLKMW